MPPADSYRVAKSTRRTQTCDMCKSRHQKCSGALPQCNNCELRGISCSYSKPIGIPDQPSRSDGLASPPTTGTDSRLSISSSDYARLYSQIFGDVVRSLSLDAKQNLGPDGDAFVPSQLCNASLPSFYREVSALVEEQAMFDSKQTTSESIDGSPPISQVRDLALERNFGHVLKILRDSLPPQDVSQHLLNLFFDHQNSLFYVCNRNEAQAQLGLMYRDLNQVSISWFCQMFLLFSVAVQFDDVNDDDGASYHEIGKKYMDDAVEENPQNTLWIIRAMLLLCFYQPPAKWNSIWMYLDAAIRGAQRFQLDLGHNHLKELSDKEYEEWRRLWFTTISFDRWVAIFLGRLPRIKESISRDPIFKETPYQPTQEYCVMQSIVTSLAIISGNILRDMYFSEELRLNICQKYKNELEIWVANLPNPLQQQVHSGVSVDLPKDQAEAVFNLHFMLLGAWMLLTRPFLLKVVKTKTSSTGFSGPIVSAIIADAEACISYAFQVVNSATTLLLASLSPKRSFMPLFFLINAANIIVLGAVWKRKQSGNNSLPVSFDQSPELAAIDSASQVLDFCGQRNALVRKYSILVKNLRQKLSKGLPAMVVDEVSPSATPISTSLHNSMSHSHTVARASELSSNSDPTVESSIFQIPWGRTSSTSTLANAELSRASYASTNPLNVGLEPWSEPFGLFYPTEDISLYDSTDSLQNSDVQKFLDEMMQ